MNDWSRVKVPLDKVSESFLKKISGEETSLGKLGLNEKQLAIPIDATDIKLFILKDVGYRFPCSSLIFEFTKDNYKYFDWVLFENIEDLKILKEWVEESGKKGE